MTAPEPRPTALVIDRFEAQAGRTPDNLAVVSDHAEYDYGELNARANRLARLLVSRGIGPEDIVAVARERSAGLLVALYAVLKAGAAYLPVDPRYPAGRIRTLLDDAQPACVLTDESLGDVLHPYAATSGVELLCPDSPATRAALAQLPAGNLTDADRKGPLRPENAAYVIYTSGSTGRPKGVVVAHHALSGYLRWAHKAYPGLGGGAILHSSVSFDLTVTTLFGPLTAGGTLYLGDLGHLDPGLWRAGRPAPTFLKVTPSHLPLLESLPQGALETGELVVGGEQLWGESLRRFRLRHPQVSVVNEYGPTESTVGCVVHRVAPGEGPVTGAVPIGMPCGDTRAHVLDERLRPVAAGAPGELYIAGGQLARGYLGRPGLTAERFVADPYGPAGERMYRTGDLVRQTSGGPLEFLGRTDDQLKIRSHRIEPGEVESCLVGGPGVGQACVVAADGPGGPRLVAYVAPDPDTATLDVHHLRAYVEDRLPRYMCPTDIVVLDQLPLTVNGKVDRGALPPPVSVAGPGAGASGASSEAAAPATEPERVLAGICRELLELDAVSVTDNFFTVGGDSLLAIRLVARARRAGYRLTPTDVYRSESIRALAALAEGPTASVRADH
ncbi:non-ribosomal peptide synthetase [Streptomyces sp. S07_1.15]|uniref:non-ribosomal peptide synthetase n=1 Tax=Streptomyces sp. S07_1.15 TaxID=2873925 RepID=UPI001D14FD33|nr:non-ribosomal peptide synthetase [Streptomyces sp. S07_1.15]MCC3650547.1 non-ribosomal peptide synthetase [Streptomyces sp. S07_1.15]